MRDVEAVLEEQSALARHVRAVRELAASFARVRGPANGSDQKRLAALVARQEEQIRALAEALENDRSRLMADNALVVQQERALRLQIRSLEQLAELCRRIDELLSDRIASIRATDAAAAHSLEADVLYVVRQRRRDLMMHLAVASQGQASLLRIEQGNADVIRALRSAATTTLTALRNAALVLRDLQEDAASLNAWTELLRTVDDLDGSRRSSLSQIKTGRSPNSD